jgi:protocatechuate 3,4-dioxygenase beta subunit
MMLHVADSETGQPLANSQIQVAYFGIGGNGEGHDFVTDHGGTAAIPVPDDPTKNRGANVFVVAEEHVPVAIMFHSLPRDYTIKLDPAATISGIVEDDQGRPVPGVKILIQGPSNDPGKSVNVDFQTCPVTNHDDGTWSCSYIPFDYTNEIRLLLRKKDYAATYPIIPVDQTGLTNLVLIINRGYTVMGHVTGAQGQPVAKARVKISTNEPGKNQSAKTDNDGFFRLDSVVGESENDSAIPSVETNDQGAFVIRGLIGNGPLHVDLVVQAKGFAPQTTTVALSSPTNEADFTLALGNIFRGHVVDEAGHPIANAVVQTDWDHQGIRTFDWQTRTDGSGGFEWDFAPAGATLFWIEADGHQVQRDVSLIADGSDHEIILHSLSSP